MAVGESSSMFTAILSSAVLSSVISSGISIWWSARTRNDDRQRDDKKEATRREHLYLDIALRLELFCFECVNRINDISEAQHRFITGEDREALGRLRELKLYFDDDPRWTELPVETVGRLKELMVRYSAAGEWIAQAFQEFADGMDASDFEAARLAYYGREASRIAREIRDRISHSRPAHVGYDAAFADYMRNCRERYNVDPDRTILPELRREFAGVRERVSHPG